MTIIDVSTTDRGTDLADQYPRSVVARDFQVEELVLWTLIPTLTAREIGQLKCVSKTWAAWPSANVNSIAKARAQEDTRDWYFPLLVGKNMFAPISSWSWSGIWHATADHSSERALALPPPTHLPRHDIIACSGGLLLVKLQTLQQHIHETKSSISDSWEPLLVCNPLRNEFRELPAANCADVGVTLWDYRGVQALMVVDREANSYKVILTFRICLCVYKSTSNSWACKRFPKPRPWGIHTPHVAAWGYICASTCVGGRLYFLDLQAGPIVNVLAPRGARDVGFLRVFEVDEETGTWKWPHNRHLLRKWHLHFLHMHRGSREDPHYFGDTLDRMSFDTGVLRYMELVECMGDLYVVIPARLDEVLQLRDDHRRDRCFAELLRDYLSSGVEHMPLMFHIIQLQGADMFTADMFTGLLRIEIPQTTSDIQERREFAFEFTTRSHDTFRNWFGCTAVGSVMWVSCLDYFLSYDVVSRKSSTQIVPENWSEEKLGFAYRPSFHMRP